MTYDKLYARTYTKVRKSLDLIRTAADAAGLDLLPFGSRERSALVDELVTHGPCTIPLVNAALKVLEGEAALVEACQDAVSDRFRLHLSAFARADVDLLDEVDFVRPGDMEDNR